MLIDPNKDLLDQNMDIKEFNLFMDFKKSLSKEVLALDTAGIKEAASVLSYSGKSELAPAIYKMRKEMNKLMHRAYELNVELGRVEKIYMQKFLEGNEEQKKDFLNNLLNA